MPVYDYSCSSCGHSFEKRILMSDCDAPALDPCPACNATESVTKNLCAPFIGDPVQQGVTKVPSDFSKYVLGKVKAAHPRGNVEKTRSIAKEV